jgi:hypothetical protein
MTSSDDNYQYCSCCESWFNSRCPKCEKDNDGILVFKIKKLLNILSSWREWMNVTIILLLLLDLIMISVHNQKLSKIERLISKTWENSPPEYPDRGGYLGRP